MIPKNMASHCWNHTLWKTCIFFLNYTLIRLKLDTVIIVYPLENGNNFLERSVFLLFFSYEEDILWVSVGSSNIFRLNSLQFDGLLVASGEEQRDLALHVCVSILP